MSTITNETTTTTEKGRAAMPRMNAKGEIELLADGYAALFGLTAGAFRERRRRGTLEGRTIQGELGARYPLSEVLDAGLTETQRERLRTLLGEFADQLAEQAEQVREAALQLKEPTLFDES